jgi:hypothetical protein
MNPLPKSLLVAILNPDFRFDLAESDRLAALSEKLFSDIIFDIFI